MRKLITCLLLLFFATSSAYANSALDEPFESFSTGNVNGQGAWTSTRAVGQYTDIDNTVSYTGSNSLHYNGFQSNIVYTNPGTTPVSQNSISFYWRPSNLATDDTGANGAMRVYVILKYNTSSKGFYLNFCHAGTGHRKLKMSLSALGNNQCTGDLMGDMTANNWYLIEAQYDLTTGKVKGRVDGGSWSPELTISSINTNYYFYRLQIQNMWSSTEHFHFDNFGAHATQQLTTTLDPTTGGGGVASLPFGDGIYCGLGGTPVCQLSYNRYSNVTLEAYPNTNWVFDHWNDGTTNYSSNPLTVNMDAPKSFMAKFFKTFRASAGSFKKNVSDFGDECVIYMRYETDIPYADINGYAYDAYQQAIDAGYATSATVPKISSIIVFASQGSMTNGHVGIVTAINGNNITIRDSNWGLDGNVQEHTVDVTNYTITGYIYHTP